MKLLNLLLGTFQAADYGNFGYNSYEYENFGNRPSRRPTSAPKSDGIPNYGPINGFTSCLSPGDRVYDNFSMLKEISGNYGDAEGAEHYAMHYCKDKYQNECDIIVKIVRNDAYQGLRMTIQLGSYRTRPCKSFQNDPTITRSIIWKKKTRFDPTPAPNNSIKAQLSYGPITGSGHKCQLAPQNNKFALNYQFQTFEDAVRFCKERANTCGIVVELTLKGGQPGKERKLFEAGSKIETDCHCPQQNMQPFKKVVAIWEKDKKQVTKPPCSESSAPRTMPALELTMYGPVIGACASRPILGGGNSPIFLQTVNWKNDRARAFNNCLNSMSFFGSECDVVVKYNYNGDDYYEIGKISQDPANPASKHCDVSKLKENEEYQSKSITITTLHKGNF